MNSGMTIAIHDILEERVRQIEKENFSHHHDDKEEYNRSMAIVAGLYALAAGGISDRLSFFREVWPRSWALHWWKPTTARHNLVKAGALIVAEIERLDRLEKSK